MHRARARSILPSLLCVCSSISAQQEPAAPDAAKAPSPPAATVAPDRTGVAWVLPFAAAKERAAKEHRLVFVPVIAGGTNPTGCW